MYLFRSLGSVGCMNSEVYRNVKMYVFRSRGTVRCLYSVVRELYPSNIFSLLQIIYDIQLFAGV
jgi:hypothetical protein